MMLPNDLLAIELGLRRNEAIATAQAWNGEAIRLGELAWDYCEARDWPALELTFNGIKIALDDPADRSDAPEDELIDAVREMVENGHPCGSESGDEWFAILVRKLHALDEPTS